MKCVPASLKLRARTLGMKIPGSKCDIRSKNADVHSFYTYPSDWQIQTGKKSRLQSNDGEKQCLGHN